MSSGEAQQRGPGPHWAKAVAVALLLLVGVGLPACGSGAEQAVVIYEVEPTDSKTSEGEAIRRAANHFRTRVEAAKVRGVVKELPGGHLRVIFPDMTSEQINKARAVLETGGDGRFRVRYVPSK